MAVKKVIVTGVYGLIAGAVFRHLHERVDAYDVYGLARRRHASERAGKGDGRCRRGGAIGC
jgi:nucleoside-diphosphate-sugar epimerase